MPWNIGIRNNTETLYIPQIVYWGIYEAILPALELIMFFRVFQDGIRVSTLKFPGWEIDTFPTFEQAQEHAVKWCYPCIITNYKEWPHPKELNVPVNMSYCEIPVMIEIKEVSGDY